MKCKLFFLTVFIIIFAMSVNVYANDGVDTDINKIAEKIYETVSSPTVGSIGGEWAVIGLVRSDADIPENYYDIYYENVKSYIKECSGILHEKKYTEYSRVIIALTAIGKNPADVEGYNLLTPLDDYDKTVWQGLNGSIWALIALDSGNYEIPQNSEAAIHASREIYVQKILNSQNSDGGWSLTKNSASDVDITAMALTALSNYKSDKDVQTAIDKALIYLSEMQNSNGTFSSSETENSESCSQVLVALCTLGIDINDNRFVKNGYSVFDGLMTFYNGNGGFKHTYNGIGSNQMATEQGLYALDAYKRVSENKQALFNMSDVKKQTNTSFDYLYGLPGKNADVKKKSVISNKTFSDIKTNFAQKQIVALASRDIINGKTENTFEPDSLMTRAEFATIITKSLGLAEASSTEFSDVSQDNWFFGYVSAAYNYGIITGVSDNEFNPNGLITKEEAAVMVSRAAKLCGLNNKYEVFSIRDILSEFTDYIKTSDWSREAFAFCYDKKILLDEAIEINPKASVTRAEIAVMLYNLLAIAKLL